ncbi:hypothetical protein GCM10010246_03620 [Streptomyces cuspidosporus]|uniref:Uncharacterized protein n=1 Tax=Streptomyces cuspidosporus TaxID=66882 RepID=A0ABN3FBI9_9ACTN
MLLRRPRQPLIRQTRRRLLRRVGSERDAVAPKEAAAVGKVCTADADPEAPARGAPAIKHTARLAVAGPTGLTRVSRIGERLSTREMSSSSCSRGVCGAST